MIEKDGESAERLRVRAELRRILGDEDAAYQDICRAVDLSPTDASLRKLKAEKAFDQGYDETAHLEYKAAFELQPGDENTLVWYARTMFYCDRFEEALDFCKKHRLADHEARVNLLKVQGSCLFYLGRYREALGPLSEAVEHHSVDRSMTFKERAECYLRLGMPNEAIEDLKQCLVDYYADIPATCLLMGVALLELNRPQEAAEMFTRTVDETGLEASRALAYLGRSKAHLLLGMNNQALADSEAARHISPEIEWKW